jgi:hypothetical protein
MSAADMNRWQFGYAISNHTHTLQDHFALYIMFTYQSKDTETWYNYLQGNLSVKDPQCWSVTGIWLQAPLPRQVSGWFLGLIIIIESNK